MNQILLAAGNLDPGSVREQQVLVIVRDLLDVFRIDKVRLCVRMKLNSHSISSKCFNVLLARNGRLPIRGMDV